MATDDQDRLAGFLADPQQSDTAKRLATFLSDPKVGEDDKQRALALYQQQHGGSMLPTPGQTMQVQGAGPQAPQQPAGTRADLVNDARKAGSFLVDTAPEMGLSAAGEAVGGPFGSGVGGVLGRTASSLLTKGELPSAKDAAVTFGMNAAAPYAARALTGIAGKVLGRGSDDAIRLMEDARAANVPVSAGEMNPRAARVQGGLDKLPTAGGTVEALDKAQNEALANYVRQSVVRPMGGGGSAGAIGREVQEESIPALVSAKKVNHAMYGSASRQATADGIAIPVPNDIVDAAGHAIQALDDTGIPAAQQGRLRAVLDTLAKRGQPTSVDTGLLDAQGQPIIRTMPPEPMPFREMEAMQRDLRNVTPAYGQRGQTTSFDVGAIERVSGLLDHAMEQSVQGTAAEPLLRAAKDNYKSEVVPLKQAVKAINGQAVTPDQAIDILVRNRRPDRLRTMLSALPPDQGSALRAGWFQSTLEQSTDAQTGQFSPQRFLTSWNKLGSEAQNLVSGGQADEVGRAVRVMRGVQSRRSMTGNPSRTAIGLGSIAQMAGAGGMIRDVASGNVGGAALDAAGFMAPPALAKILATPGAARYFAIGLTAPPGSGPSRQALDTLARVVGKVGAGVSAREAGMTARDAAVGP